VYSARPPPPASEPDKARALSATEGLVTRDTEPKQSIHVGNLVVTAPLVIVDITYYSDGGTTGVLFTDADGNSGKFCRDGRIRAPGTPPGIRLDDPYSFYVGAFGFWT